MLLLLSLLLLFNKRAEMLNFVLLFPVLLDWTNVLQTVELPVIWDAPIPMATLLWFSLSVDKLLSWFWYKYDKFLRRHTASRAKQTSVILIYLYGSSQRETTLHCNVTTLHCNVSFHWPSPYWNLPTSTAKTIIPNMSGVTCNWRWGTPIYSQYREQSLHTMHSVSNGNCIANSPRRKNTACSFVVVCEQKIWPIRENSGSQRLKIMSTLYCKKGNVLFNIAFY